MLPRARALRFHLRTPLAIYSRATLNQLLLRRAETRGRKLWRTAFYESAAEMHAAGKSPAAAKPITRILWCWRRARAPGCGQTLAEDFLPRDFMLTFGYYLPVPCEVLRVQFYEKFEGYAWAFPRPDHVSVGICGKAGEETMAALRDRLDAFMQTFGYAPDPQRIFSHLLPSLSLDSWGGLRLVGQGWALVGDAAGLVDPVTGEGIYYAMRSGELLALRLCSRTCRSFTRSACAMISAVPLALGARLASWFYHGEFLGGGVTTRMIEFGAHSREVSARSCRTSSRARSLTRD